MPEGLGLIRIQGMTAISLPSQLHQTESQSLTLSKDGRSPDQTVSDAPENPHGRGRIREQPTVASLLTTLVPYQSRGLQGEFLDCKAHRFQKTEPVEPQKSGWNTAPKDESNRGTSGDTHSVDYSPRRYIYQSRCKSKSADLGHQSHQSSLALRLSYGHRRDSLVRG